MFDRKYRLVPVVLAAVLLPFCGGKAQSSGSSESHFLEPCGAGCKGGFECVCGVCTEPCEADTACNDLGIASSVCTAGAPGSSCGQTICDVLCDRDADCGGVGDGFVCEGGRCRHQAAAPTCDDAEADVTAFAQASKDCEVDDDCVQVESSCYTQETCAAAVALERDYDVSEWERLTGKLQSCREPCAACSMPAPAAACVSGKCRLGGGAAPTCKEREQEAGQAVSTALEQADSSCSVDDDCVEIGISTICHAACGAIVSRAGATTMNSVIEGLDTGLCSTFEADGCVALIPPCTPPAGQIGCVAGRCANTYCGDGACTSGELAASCPADCLCGDGACSADETTESCPADCLSNR